MTKIPEGLSIQPPDKNNDSKRKQDWYSDRERLQRCASNSYLQMSKVGHFLHLTNVQSRPFSSSHSAPLPVVASVNFRWKAEVNDG